MSDWQVGDLAVCVDDQPRHGDTQDLEFANLKAGRVYRVVKVTWGGHGLHVDGAPVKRESGWWSDRFRKVTPDKREACEDEFVTLLKRIRENA
jgi:hypothetical protein